MIRDDTGPASLDPFWTGIAPTYRAAPALRRRVAVFGVAFLLLASLSLLYDYSRPAEYRTAARLRIDMPGHGDTADERRSASRAAFLTEVEVLTSRPTVDKAVGRLAIIGVPMPDESLDPAEDYRRMLTATPVDGTNVVQLTANGSPPEVLPTLVNTLIDVYRNQLAERYRQDSSSRAAKAQAEAERLAVRVTEKREALDEFRSRHDIVSLEREENQVLSQVKGVGQSLNIANDRLVAAEAKLRSLRDSVAAGNPVVRARDNPTLSNLEQRASQLREEQHEMERTYTPDFLAFDPRAKALRMRLANLDEQMKQVREGGQRAALNEAEEEVTAARAAVERLKQQAGGDRRAVQAFTARLGEFKAMQEELAGLEDMHRAAVVQATGLQAAERIRVPEITLLEAAFAPGEPWRPQYGRDAAIGVSASLLLALLATWIVELFNRTPAGPSLVVAPAWVRSLQAPAARTPEPLAGISPSALLAGAAQLPRELNDAEIAQLLDELPDDLGIVALGLLSGLSIDEIARLEWAAVDLEHRRIRPPDRTLRLSPAFERQLDAYRGRRGDADGGLVVPAPLRTREAVDAALLYAAHDAGLAGADEITAASLRHSYVAYLVRQGVRFADLAGIVGRLPADLLGAYTALSPAGRKRALDEIDLFHPALRQIRFG
ncbi:GumC family protein [Aromatoleum sp.]|uniref:GumC family protein n=1 Tax=Aromatoleum sp. TaxID=2307007 RepID=UPI002FC6F710